MKPTFGGMADDAPSTDDDPSAAALAAASQRLRELEDENSALQHICRTQEDTIDELRDKLYDLDVASSSEAEEDDPPSKPADPTATTSSS